MFKNVASQKLVVFAFDSTTNLPKSGDAANITAYVSKDGGAVTVLGDTSATEMDATNAKGCYLFDLTQAETNGDMLVFSAKSSTANIVVIGSPQTVFTYPASFTALTAATIASLVWDEAIAGHITAGSTAARLNSIPDEFDNADTLLDRDMSVGLDSGSPSVRTPRQALRFLRNKWAIAAGTLTVKKEDDTTTSWTATVSTDAAAVPIIGNDPA